MSPDLEKDISERRSQRARISVPSNIHPFGSILKEEPASNRYRPTPLKTDPSVVDDNMTLSTVDDLAGSFETKFLVEASSQEGMAPVRITFQNFPSASSFLNKMADECNLHEWSASTQLLRENSDWQSMQTVVAASVKFEWSGFEIRVRRGEDGDWAAVIEELHRAWKAKELNAESSSVQSFMIKVMLHVR
jgi:hypothetical protein